MSKIVNNEKVKPITCQDKSKLTGRPVGSKTDEKTRILRRLKKIWQNEENKTPEIVQAAQLYADLLGWRKEPQDTTVKEVMKVIFERDSKKIVPETSNELLTNYVQNVSSDVSSNLPSDESIITDTTTTETTTETTTIMPSNQPDNDDNEMFIER